jgi:branched-chain amino acid transport system substrate-binding protein
MEGETPQGGDVKNRRIVLMMAVILLLMTVAACAPAPTPVPTAAPPTAAPPTAAPQTAAPKPTEAPKATSAPTVAATTAPTSAPTAAPTAAAAKAGGVYKIGFISAATGAGASLGVAERDVAKLVSDQLKASGITGPDGVKHEVQVLIFDDQSSADTAATLARRLIEQDQVQVLVGTSQTGPSTAIVPIATEAKVPNISMASARALIEDPQTKQMRPWIFKPVPENSHSADKQAEYLKAVGVTKVCHLYENSSYGQDTFAAASASFPKSGIQIVYSDAFDPKATEFPQLAKAKASGCQAIVIGAIPPASPVMNVAVRDSLPDIRIIHGHGSCSPDLIKAAGKAAEGTVMPCGKILVADSLPDSDPVKALDLKLIKDYATVSKDPISTFAGHSYDSLQWAIAALKTLPDGLSLADQRAKVRDALETKIQNFPTTHGLYTTSPTDHLGFNGADFAMVVVKDGKFVVLPKDQWK